MPKAIAQTDAQVVFATAFPFLHMYHAPTPPDAATRPLSFWSNSRRQQVRHALLQTTYKAIEQADAYIAHTTFERDHLVQRASMRQITSYWSWVYVKMTHKS